jgi:hypothetical protein
MVTFQANITFLGLNSIGASLSFVARLPLKDVRKAQLSGAFGIVKKLPFELGCSTVNYS